MAISDVDKILNKMGYYESDPQKKAEIQGYIDEAVEFMKECGVPDDQLATQRAYAVKSIWADKRDKGDDDNILKKEGMIISLISQMRRSKNAEANS